MDAAELYAQWDGLSPSERLEALEELVNDELVTNGYDEVEIEVDDLPESADSATVGNYDEGTITFDTDHVLDDPAQDVIETAFHEAGHAMRDQDGLTDLIPEEALEGYNDVQGFEGYYDENGELQIDSVYNPYHQDVYDYGAHRTEQALAPVLGPPPGETASPTAYGVQDFPFEIDWDNAVIRTEPAEPVIEVDWDNVVVTPE